MFQISGLINEATESVVTMQCCISWLLEDAEGNRKTQRMEIYDLRKQSQLAQSKLSL